jgi:hypothetical protein
VLLRKNSATSQPTLKEMTNEYFFLKKYINTVRNFAEDKENVF